MALITPAMLTKETLVNFQNTLVVAGHANWMSDEFAKDPRIGNVINVRRPVAFTPNKNNMAWIGSNASVLETRVPFAINRSVTQPLAFTQGELSMAMQRFSDRYLKPAVTAIAAGIDADVLDSIANSTLPTLSATQGFSTAGLNTVGDQAGTPSAAGYCVGAFGTAMSADTVLLAKQYLTEVGCPPGEIYGILTAKMERELMVSQQNAFNPFLEVDRIYRAGEIGTYSGIKMKVSQSCATHTNGTAGTIAVTSGTLTSGWAESATMLVTSSANVAVGDVFSAVPKLVNQLTKTAGTLAAQFQVVSIPDATHVVLSPAPISAGQYKNIVSTIDGTTLTLVGAAGASGQEGLIYHKSALGVASIPLPTDGDPRDVFNMEDDSTDGFIIRYIKQFDGLGVSGFAGAGGVGLSGPASIRRFDVGWGCKVLNTAFVVRLRS